MLYAYFIFRSFAHLVPLVTANPAPFPQLLSAEQPKGGTPSEMSLPLGIQISVILREWRAQANKWGNSRDNVTPAGYTNFGNAARVLTSGKQVVELTRECYSRRLYKFRYSCTSVDLEI